MNTFEKKNLINVMFWAGRAASSTRNLFDSRFIENYLSEKEMQVLEDSAKFLTEIEERFAKMCEDEEWEAWE